MTTLEQLARHARQRGFTVHIFSTGAQAADAVCDICRDHTVGLGSSMTLETLGIASRLTSYAKRVLVHRPGRAGEAERLALTADLFLTSANAMSLDGQIVNIDGTGNRVAATCFGPQRVIYCIGRNKLTPTLPEAMVRAKTTAVKLAAHFHRKTPCVVTGQCEECLSPECVCAITTIHRKKPYGTDISIFLINEAYGL